MKISLYAPLSGPLVPLTQVPDPVFAQKMMGDGLAIDPTSQSLLAPCDGEIIQVHSARHALTMRTPEGVEILLHVGIDTVQLKGEGFTPQVQAGRRVRQGDVLLKFDADLLAQKAKSLITLMIIADPKGGALRFLPRSRAEAGRDILMELTPVAPDHVGSTRKVAESAPLFTRGGFAAHAPLSREIHFRSVNGLHARPAAELAQLAKTFSSSIHLRRGHSGTANAKSVVSLLQLELRADDRIVVTAEGTDAEKALQSTAQFLAALQEENLAPAPERSTETTRPPATPRPSGSVPVSVGGSAQVGASGTSADATSDRGRAGFYQATGISPGLALGPIQKIVSSLIDFPENSNRSPKEEMNLLQEAFKRAKQELRQLVADLHRKKQSPTAAIFAAHEEFLEDPELEEQVRQILARGKTAAYAWSEAVSGLASRMEKAKTELIAQRAQDLRDVGHRVLRQLMNDQGKARDTTNDKSKANGSGEIAKTKNKDPKASPAGLLLADNLVPSQVAELDLEKVAGIATRAGNQTSHVAILARSLGIPAVAGLPPEALLTPEGTMALIDGNSGIFQLNPNAEEQRQIQSAQQQMAEKRQQALRFAHENVHGIGGRALQIHANISSVEAARKAVASGAEGVGLLRTEFLFHDRATAPTEDEQQKIYQEIVDVLDGKPLTIRTLDVGGDKPLAYLGLPPEENPFLGVRGIRVCLKNLEIFRPQLRAILRVQSKGPIHVMFPMITTLDEFRQARALLEEEQKNLGVANAPSVGMMVEVPAAALMAEEFAPLVDFFSVGTNDLTQYTLAADRGNSEVHYEILQESVFRLIQMSVTAAHRHGKWVGVCGDLAGQEKAVPRLLELGVDELSVNPTTVPLLKAQIRELTGSPALSNKGTLYDPHQDVVFLPAEDR
ncbi:MAG: phosphoenolpyruvate--protein phosphotransferase [Bdellovibrio sp.]|nr:MAG: phosphoenolpyruvate--protein phosphotransferase [Bdellovibrio sp.]